MDEVCRRGTGVNGSVRAVLSAANGPAFAAPENRGMSMNLKKAQLQNNGGYGYGKQTAV